MIPDYLKNHIKVDDLKFDIPEIPFFPLPEYKPDTHYLELTKESYFKGLIVLRHYLKIISDYYFAVECNAKNIDLFMITPSLSSPMGPGSNSSPIPIKFGKYDSFLTDSSQFGFEPLLLNNIDKVYCYLPSMRGEEPDSRHINQFFHCEAEIKGTLHDLIPIVEKYIQIIAEAFLLMPSLIKRMSMNPEQTFLTLNRIRIMKTFPEITFDFAVECLVNSGNKNLVIFHKTGRDISCEGELKLAELLNFSTPFWIKNYDRDRVPFYQKPHPENTDKVINADLIFPPIIQNAFGGEIVGCGQRQDSVEELFNSLSRQNIEIFPYEWYINLRKLPNYKSTSGFGLGIERFITWSLCQHDIKNAILYPRLKDIKTYP